MMGLTAYKLESLREAAAAHVALEAVELAADEARQRLTTTSREASLRLAKATDLPATVVLPGGVAVTVQDDGDGRLRFLTSALAE